MIPNPPIPSRLRWAFFVPPVILYALLGCYFHSQGIAWGLDAWLSLSFLIVVIVLNRYLRIGITGYLLLNLALITHNLGAVGAYSLTWGVFGYDNFQHVLSSAVAAYITFHFVARKFHIKKHRTVQRSVVDDHIAVLILLVFALVSFLGVGIELLEFGGYVFLGEGDGIFMAGSGDSDTLYGGDGNYVDTMTDILFNAAGCLVGVLVYYFGTYHRRSWKRY